MRDRKTMPWIAVLVGLGAFGLWGCKKKGTPEDVVTTEGSERVDGEAEATPDGRPDRPPAKPGTGSEPPRVTFESLPPIFIGESVRDVHSGVGVRDYRQVRATFARLTGVSTMDPQVRQAFDELSTQLPGNNDARSFLGSHQVAIAKLAVEFCDRLVESPELRKAVLPDFAFDRGTAFSLASETQYDQLIDGLVPRFWGEPLSSRSDAQEVRKVLRQLLADLIQGLDGNDPKAARSVVKGVCTAVLASAQTTLL